MMKKRAFTLAEVLITLAIIGIIAALTIPNLMTKYQKMVLRSQFLKTHSTLQNAMKQIAQEQDLYSDIVYNAKTQGKGNLACNNVMKVALLEKLNVVNGSDNTSYFSNFSQGYKNKLGDKASHNNWGWYGQFMLQDGADIYPECSGSCSVIYLFFDTNGFKKKPNRNGVDLFCYQLNSKNELVSCSNWGTTCSATNNAAGWDCLNQALTDPKYFDKLKL